MVSCLLWTAGENVDSYFAPELSAYTIYHQGNISALYFFISQCQLKSTMSAKSHWNTHAVVGIIYPPSFLRCQSNNCEPPSPVIQC